MKNHKEKSGAEGQHIKQFFLETCEHENGVHDPVNSVLSEAATVVWLNWKTGIDDEPAPDLPGIPVAWGIVPQVVSNGCMSVKCLFLEYFQALSPYLVLW